MSRSESHKKTREKRKTQECSVYEIKLDKSHLSNAQKEFLSRLFLEAKWLYNCALSSKNVFSFDYKTKVAKVLNKERKEELRDIAILPSQIKQAIIDRMRDSIKGLSRLKENGHKVGKLKFRSEINSLPLKQCDVTYKIENVKYIKLQKFKKAFKVIGLAQIPKDVEFANANFVRKNGDYFLYITTFSQKDDSKKIGEIGLDFGVKNCITDSNGETYNFKENESKRQKRLHKSLSRKKKGSKNREKAKSKLKKEYAKTKKRKNDKVNKFISKMKKYKRVYVQKEGVKEWHKSNMKNVRKAVQQSAMGGIIERLKNNRSTFVIDRWFASTKTCSSCGEKQSVSLSERTYRCNSCGYEKDRDTNSAINILNEGRRVRNANVEKSLVEKFASDSNELSDFVETRSLNASA